MKIEQQVCTLEQAKRLKELGIEQRSIFYHFGGKVTNVAWGNDYFAAFTVAELGVMLLSDCKTQIISGYWSASFHSLNNKSYYESGFTTEAEARAAMLIYLLENNLTTASSVNTRLKENKF